MIHFRIFGSTQQVVDGNIKIIGQCDQCFVVGLPRSGFITADAILVHIQIDGQPDLRYVPFFPQLFKSENAPSPLDKIIPKWYNPNIPFWYYPVKIEGIYTLPGRQGIK